MSPSGPLCSRSVFSVDALGAKVEWDARLGVGAKLPAESRGRTPDGGLGAKPPKTQHFL